MKKPVKWKIFKAAGIVHLVLLGLFIGAMITGFIINAQSGRSDLLHIIVGVLIFAAGAGIVLVNNILNLYLVIKYYPDKKPGNAFLNTHFVFSIISIFVYLLLLVLWVVAIYYSIVPDPAEEPDEDEWLTNIILVMFTIFMITGIIQLSMQMSLRNTIRNNYARAFDSFLNQEQ